MRRGLLALAVAAVGTTAVSAGALAEGGGEPVGSELSVELREWAIDANRVRAGEVDLVTRNTGKVEHELLVVRTDRAADELPTGLEGVRPELAGEVVVGRVHRDHSHAPGARKSDEHVAPGGERRERVRLTPGRYVLVCPIPGHYEAGQRAEFVVR